ncbi:putative arabinose efflux permease, MFS family [Streptoalloteichus tenebrarius]|uniref:Arabinose efflux permease, MFS family n=1 Tax=Streptoalloteichus tenebrarius (strain ATCC 17920 / DSM 40477 / JCM 4838 / CBS 697.72 / NBRC 16177 / NCIMB 11028 / NRRL B-12390 / A12253. 1 / ISP 5477) TaxID=1933 RepID=A0ABT1HNK2_STRSD|nr:MFS transporter [Streptoalloteichus tenebrarius]MCP2257088.1 putative arabinose efflux permease, MFS family [Streptoalloteichus tenebrarius]BFE98720.1 MFS transporter [Streptoalloteichus tenebrarius]
MPRSATTLAKTTHPEQHEDQQTNTAAPPAPARWIWLAAWPVTAVFVLSNAATPLYVLWQHDIGFSKGTLTVVFACYIVGLLGSLLVSGVASDRWGRKPVLLPALALSLLACAIFATATTVTALLIARLFTGIAVGAVVSAGMAAVTDVAGPHRQRLAALLASTAMVFGAGLGPFLAGLLSETLPAPTTTVFVVEAVLLTTALLATLRMPVPRPTTTTGAWIRVPRVPRGAGLRLALGIAVFAPGITATSFVVSLGPSVLATLLNTPSRTVAGTLAFAMFATATAVQFTVRALPRTTILLAGATSTALGMAALVTAVHTQAVAPLVTSALLAGAGQGMGQLGGLSLLNSSVPPRRLAEANAAFNVGGYLPAGALPVAAGYLSDAVGLTTGATLFGSALLALAVLGGAVVLAARPRLTTSA